VIPFSKVSKELDPEPMKMKPGQRGPDCEFHSIFHCSYANVSIDDPELVDGMPCSIQVFTSRMRDEECLEIAGMVDKCLMKAEN
jgi:amidase